MISRQPIKDAPFHPVIEPGEPEPGKCIAEGPGLTNAVSGETAHFTIIARVCYRQTPETGIKQTPEKFHEKSS
jgi:hypothetical protein